MRKRRNSDEPTKDDRYREKDDNWRELVAQLVNMILGDESYGKGKINGRIESVTRAIEKVKDKKIAEKPLKSFCANEVDESTPNVISRNENGVEALQKDKEELQSFGEQLKQIMAILQQKHQSNGEAKVYTMFANILRIAMNYCSKRAQGYFLNEGCSHQVEGHHGVETEGGKLILTLPQTPDSIQINQKGKTVEVHNQEIIDQEKQGNQVVLTLQFEGGRELNPAEMGFHLRDLTDESFSLDFSAEEFRFICDNCGMKDVTVKAENWDEDTNNAPKNEANVKLSPDETCVSESYKDNANVLVEIFQEHPNIIDNFELSSQKLQEYFMNELAQIYQKIIKGNPEMLKLDDITSMEAMVRDMERTGLQVTWLKDKLANSHERVENQEVKRKFLERINSYKTETEETEQEQAQSARR